MATDRFRLSHRELSWDPRTPDDTLAALVPAKVLGDTAKSLTSGSEVTIALSTSGSGEGIIGFEGAAAGGTLFVAGLAILFASFFRGRARRGGIRRP